MNNKLLLSGLAAGMSLGGLAATAAEKITKPIVSANVHNTIVTAQQNSARRPNILFIYSDDHSTRTIGAYGSQINKTPNIDKIANEGAIFTRSYCANSICCPARANVLTGKHSNKNGMLINGSYWNGNQQIFPRLLKKAGYQTALIGKWHMKPVPTNEFDYWMVLSGGGGQGHYYNPDFISINGPKKFTGFSTDIITDQSIKWLEKRDPKKPFLMMTQFKAPHVHRTPALRYLNKYEGQTFPVPETYFDDYATRQYAKKCWMRMHGMPERNLNITPPKSEYKPGMKEFKFLDLYTEAQRNKWLDAYEARNRAYFALKAAGKLKKGSKELALYKYQRFIKDYLRCVAGIDDNVGKLLDYLKKNNLDKNTIVIYSSDQSFFIGEHGWIDKRWMYEEALTTPFVIRWPAVIKPGSHPNEMIQNIDYAPTFLQAAGVPIPKDIQGKSLMPILEGKHPADWRNSIYYHYYHAGAYNLPRHDGVRTDRYKLINFYTDGNWELFDLKEDPQELKNIYGDPKYKAVVVKMKVELEKLRKQYDLKPADFVDARKSRRGKKAGRKPGKKVEKTQRRTAVEIVQQADGSVIIDTSAAAITGDTLLASGKGKASSLHHWRNSSDYPEWSIKIIKPGKYVLTANAANRKSAILKSSMAGQTQEYNIEATGKFSKYKKVIIGKFKIKAGGIYRLTLKAVKAKWRALNLKNIQLKPAE
jgi:arylsulfatase A-like enzyme